MTKDGHGSGVAYNVEGRSYVMTTAHGFNPGEKVWVELNGKKINCKLLVHDPTNDLAIIYPETHIDSGISFSDVQDVGTEVWYVGTVSHFQGSVLTGVIANVDIEIDAGIHDATSVKIIEGCSGGGIYDKATGNCLGIIVRTDDALGYYVPTRTIRKWAASHNAPLVIR